MFNWFDFTEIFLQLLACYMCFLWGKASGISKLIDILLDKKIITEKDLDKLSDS